MRHAQRHFLNVQARQAVTEALDRDHQFIESEVAHDVEWATKTFGKDPETLVVGLRHKHTEAITDAARALIRAELLHRALLRAEGKE